MGLVPNTAPAATQLRHGQLVARRVGVAQEGIRRDRAEVDTWQGRGAGVRVGLRGWLGLGLGL